MTTTGQRIIAAAHQAVALARGKRNRPENAIQADIVDYLNAVLHPRDYLVYATPNASRRTTGGKASNAVPGLTPGIPDLSIVSCFGRIYFLEVKTRTGVLSKSQEAIRDRLDAMAVPLAVVRSVEDVRVALEHWNIVTREARAAQRKVAA